MRLFAFIEPAASINRLSRAVSLVSFGRNDLFLPVLFQPTRVGLHGDLEVALVSLAIGRRVLQEKIGIADDAK